MSSKGGPNTPRPIGRFPDQPHTDLSWDELNGTQRDELYRDMLDQHPDLVMCLNPQGRVLYANQSARNTLAFSSVHAIGDQTIYDLLDEQSRESFDQLTASVNRHDAAGPIPLGLVDDQGRLHGVEAKLNGRFDGPTLRWYRLAMRRTDPQPTRRPPTEAEESAPAEQVDVQQRILIVEDEEVAARMLARMLHNSGYDTDRAATGAEALDKIAEHDYDAMTLDLALPDRDGLDLLHQIRATRHTSELPVIVVSASADETRQQLTGDAAHVADWLNKPLEHGALHTAVGQAVEIDEHGRPRLLHVEQDDAFFNRVRQTLSDVATTEQAKNLAEARHKLRHSEDYDLVLLDLTLPDGLGAELLPFLNRPRGRTVPVILVSSGGSTNALAEHVADELVKSSTTEQQMLETIQSHLR